MVGRLGVVNRPIVGCLLNACMKQSEDALHAVVTLAVLLLQCCAPRVPMCIGENYKTANSRLIIYMVQAKHGYYCTIIYNPTVTTI